jgi:voltage-gated potassium channel Kch
LYRWFEPVLGWFERERLIEHREKREQYDAILFGYHRVGTDFLPSLQRWKKKYLVVDFDPEVIRHLTEKGIPCRYGDAEDNEFLDELNLRGVRMIVSTIPDFEVNAFLVDKLRKHNKKAVAIMTAHTVEEASALYEAGASYVTMPHFLGGTYAALLVEKHGFVATRFAGERKRHLKHILSKSF